MKQRSRRQFVADQASTQALEFAEKAAAETLDDARKAYDALYERVYKFGTLLASGAGAAGIYGLGKIGQPGAAGQVATLLALSAWWFTISAFTLLHGGSSRPLAAGTAGDSVRERFLKRLSEKGSDADALWYTRWDQVKAVDEQAAAYADGTSARARALDKAYRCLVASLAVVPLAYVLTQAT